MAAGDSETISAASRRARDAFCSPSAAITCCQINISQNTSPLPLPGNVQHIATLYGRLTLARASRAASASAAIARCSCTGSRTSLLQCLTQGRVSVYQRVGSFMCLFCPYSLKIGMGIRNWQVKERWRRCSQLSSSFNAI